LYIQWYINEIFDNFPILKNENHWLAVKWDFKLIRKLFFDKKNEILKAVSSYGLIRQAISFEQCYDISVPILAILIVNFDKR